MCSAPAGAEPFNGYIGRCQDYVNGVALLPLACQLFEVLTGQGFTQRVVLVENLGAQGKIEGGGFLGLDFEVVFLDGIPPGRDGGLVGSGFGGREGGNEIRNYSALGRLELAVPDEINGDFPGKKRAIVVLKKHRLLFLSKHSGCGDEWNQRSQKEEL